MSFEIVIGNALDVLKSRPAESINCCVTSPPYWGLRDYKVPGQIGLEPTPELYVEHIVQIFQEVRRVLREDGTCWINLGDSYASKPFYDGDTFDPKWKQARNRGRNNGPNRQAIDGLKPKNLIGIPWRVAFALQADGWYLRSDIIWSKPNPMPESVTDRPTKAHEYIFLLSKSAKYFYEADAIREPQADRTAPRLLRAHSGYEPPGQSRHSGILSARHNFKRESKEAENLNGGGLKQHRMERDPTAATGFRNKRSVWTISTCPTPEAHFATYPIDLVEPCILAGCPKDGIVLDPFCGAGTTGLACLKHGLNFLGIELNPDFVEIAHSRARKFYPLFFAAQKNEPGTVPGFNLNTP